VPKVRGAEKRKGRGVRKGGRFDVLLGARWAMMVHDTSIRTTREEKGLRLPLMGGTSLPQRWVEPEDRLKMTFQTELSFLSFFPSKGSQQDMIQKNPDTELIHRWRQLLSVPGDPVEGEQGAINRVGLQQRKKTSPSSDGGKL